MRIHARPGRKRQTQKTLMNMVKDNSSIKQQQLLGTYVDPVVVDREVGGAEAAIGEL